MAAVLKLAVGLAFAGFLTGQALAQSRVTEATKYYSITGKTGMELFWDMNRRGPRHGFLTKAIAQTQFKTGYTGDFIYENGVCRAKNASFKLQITYVYPQPKTRLEGPLARRWKAFQATNFAHEREHGRIAKKMAASIGRKLKTFRVADKRSCDRPIAKLAKEIDAIIIAQNVEQKAFDTREHRKGGPVEKSILALVGKR